MLVLHKTLLRIIMYYDFLPLRCMRYIGTPSGVFVLAPATTNFDWSWGHSYSFLFQCKLCKLSISLYLVSPYLPLALYLEVLHHTPSCLGVPTGPEALSWSWCTGPESQTFSTALLSLLIRTCSHSVRHFSTTPSGCS